MPQLSDSTFNDSNRPIRICQIPDGTGFYPPLGADTSSWETHRLSIALSALGYPVQVYSAGKRLGDYPYAIKRVYSPAIGNREVSKLLFGVRLAKLFPRIVRSFEVIHYHAPVPAAFTLALKIERPATVITWGDPFLGGNVGPKRIWNTMASRSGSLLSRWASIELQIHVLKRVDRIIAVSSFLRERLHTTFGIASEKIDVVHPGVDTEKFSPSLDPLPLRIKLRLTGSRRVIVCPARVTPLKSQIDLIRALPKLVSKHNVCVLFVGEITDPLYHNLLLHEAAKLGVTNSIYFTGTVSGNDFPLYYRLADVVVLPSEAEGLPSSLLEAMSCGCAIVASDIPACREVAVTGREIKFFELHQTDRLADEVSFILASPLVQEGMGLYSRSTALEHYSWTKVSKDTLKCYQRAIMSK